MGNGRHPGTDELMLRGSGGAVDSGGREGGHDVREYGRHDQNQVTQTFHDGKTIIILKDSTEVGTSGKQLR